MRSDPDNQSEMKHPPKPRLRTKTRIRTVSEGNIIRLLDLSTYEKPRETPEQFKARMTENIAALIVLALFICIASAGFRDIEKHQSCANISQCGH